MKTRRTALALAAVLVVAPLAGTASAHVTVQAPGATQGGYTKLIFRAPTERDVPTTKLEIAFPADQPLTSVSVKPKTGWSYQVVKAPPAKPVTTSSGEPVTEVVTRIVWTATAGGIKAGEFDEFEVSAGRLPEAEQMVFKALQTYANGEVVRWIEEPVAGGDEPEHPAPVLKLAPKAGATTAPPTTPVANAETGVDYGIVALGLAALALVVSVVGAVRAKPRPSNS